MSKEEIKKDESSPLYQSDIDYAAYTNSEKQKPREAFEIGADIPSDNETPALAVVYDVAPKRNYSKKKACLFAMKAIPSVIIGAGTGMAMTPIFNHLIKESEFFGQDIHKNDYVYAISSLNTVLIYSTTATLASYYYFKSSSLNTTYTSNCTKVSIYGAKICGSMAALIPLSLLWGVELQNQNHSHSSGFDQFLAWATFTTLPLTLYKSIDASRSIDKIYINRDNINLNSTGAKAFVYTPIAISLVGRFIAYGYASYNMCKAFGLDDTSSMALGAIGGSSAAISTSVLEYNALKGLFKKHPEYNCKNVVGGIFSAIEGAWLAIPTVSVGLAAISGWNPFVKATIFAPLFFTDTALQASNIYNAGDDFDSSVVGLCNTIHDE